VGSPAYLTDPLYELDRDPGEAYNVAETEPQRARELREKLEEWRAGFRENPRGWRGPR